MTALKEYEKLEATGLWRQSPATQRREVIVSFGNTALLIADTNDSPLSHWSMPAIQRLNPAGEPAIYAPDSEATETLEIEDADMIAAIEKVRAAINRRRPRPGRLRWVIVAATALTLAALAIFWLPDALIEHTKSVVPPEKRQQIGLDLLIRLTRLSGTRCTSQRGNAALGALEKRLFDDNGKRILIVPGGVVKSAHLPGGFILLNRALVEDFETPGVAAGYVLIEDIRARTVDPLGAFLNYAGALSAFRLLTTGQVSQAALDSYAQHLLVKPPARVSDERLLRRFEMAGFSSTPLAYGIDMTGETTLTLIEADPFGKKPFEPLLSDADWVSLQDICEP